MTSPGPIRHVASQPPAALARVGGLEASTHASKLRSLHFMSLRDIGLFLRGARTDQAVRTLRAGIGSRDAFESVYGKLDDPRASDDRRYRYQRLKYARVVAALPSGRRYGRTLDLGCGLGLLSQALAARSDEVLGPDIAQGAINHAWRRVADVANLRFERADFTDLPRSLDGQFDLAVLADTLCYLLSADRRRGAQGSRCARGSAPRARWIVPAREPLRRRRRPGLVADSAHSPRLRLVCRPAGGHATTPAVLPGRSA